MKKTLEYICIVVWAILAALALSSCTKSTTTQAAQIITDEGITVHLRTSLEDKVSSTRPNVF